MSDLPISPLQAMWNGMSREYARQRATTGMTLGGLIDALEAAKPDRTIAGLGEPHSYRGYYEDLAFEPDITVRPIRDQLSILRACMGEVFTGYKGGEFVMGRTTPVWSARYGSSGLRIVGLDTDADPITLVTAEDDG